MKAPMSASLEETSEEEFLRVLSVSGPCYEMYRGAAGEMQLRLLPPIARA